MNICRTEVIHRNLLNAMDTNVQFQEISIPPQEGGGGGGWQKQKFFKTSMELYFWRDKGWGRGCQLKNLLWGRYGYFLATHILNLESS